MNENLGHAAVSELLTIIIMEQDACIARVRHKGLLMKPYSTFHSINELAYNETYLFTLNGECIPIDLESAGIDVITVSVSPSLPSSISFAECSSWLNISLAGGCFSTWSALRTKLARL